MGVLSLAFLDDQPFSALAVRECNGELGVRGLFL